MALRKRTKTSCSEMLHKVKFQTLRNVGEGVKWNFMNIITSFRHGQVSQESSQNWRCNIDLFNIGLLTVFDDKTRFDRIRDAAHTVDMMTASDVVPRLWQERRCGTDRCGGEHRPPDQTTYAASKSGWKNFKPLPSISAIRKTMHFTYISLNVQYQNLMCLF